eukprot:2679337-Pleurochrysis_carterae.AAC.1
MRNMYQLTTAISDLSKKIPHLTEVQTRSPTTALQERGKQRTAVAAQPLCSSPARTRQHALRSRMAANA